MEEKTEEKKITPQGELKLEATNQRTPLEILREMSSALMAAVQFKVLTKDAAVGVLELTRELIHWTFTKPGEHSTPTELLAASMEAALFEKDVTLPTPTGKLKFDA